MLASWLPGSLVTEVQKVYAPSDPSLWKTAQARYYNVKCTEPLREDERVFLWSLTLAQYSPPDKIPAMPHGKYFHDWDGTRSNGAEFMRDMVISNTKFSHWCKNWSAEIADYEKFMSDAVLPQLVAKATQKQNECLKEDKPTRIVACLPGGVHYKEKRIIGPCLQWQAEDPWRGAIRIGLPIEGAAHEIFERHRDSDYVYEGDLSGQEHSFAEWTWQLCVDLRAHQSSNPRQVRAIYAATRGVHLLFPDGWVLGPTASNISGRLATLDDNSYGTEMVWRRAQWNWCRRRGLEPNLDWMKLDVLGDNALVSFYGPMARSDTIAEIQDEAWRYGYLLKIKKAPGSGPWGLVWCGFTKEGPREWLRFSSPQKMLANAIYFSRDPQIAIMQLLACYRALWNTEYRMAIQTTIERLAKAYGLQFTLPSYAMIEYTLAPYVSQGYLPQSRGGVFEILPAPKEHVVLKSNEPCESSYQVARMTNQKRKQKGTKKQKGKRALIGPRVRPKLGKRSRPLPQRRVGVFRPARQQMRNFNAPLATGNRLGSVGMSMSDRAQRSCDQGQCASVRIVGSDVMKIKLGADLVANANVYGVLGTAGASQAAGFITPFYISTRLATFAGMYAWYAFRRIKLTFVPLVGPTSVASTTAVNAAANIAVAICTDSSSDGVGGNDGPATFQQVMEVIPSTAFPAWEGGSLLYKFNGTKVWATSSNNSSTNPDTIDSAQLALRAMWSAVNAALTSVATTHNIYIEYVLDLYRPQETTVYPSIREPEEKKRDDDDRDSLVEVVGAALADMKLRSKSVPSQRA